MNILQKMRKRFRFRPPSNYQVANNQNQTHEQWNNVPGFYRAVNENHFENQFYQIDGWYDHQSLYNYQNCAENPSNENYYENNFNSAYGYQSFEENVQCTNNKRERECYKDNDQDYSCLNTAKRQKLAGPSVTYAFKKSSQYLQPMRKVLNILFESEITADGWEKVNNQFSYHTQIRGNRYTRLSSSIDKAKEQAAETALKDLCNFKFENIAWPHQLLPFRLEQSFADAIEMLV